MPSAPISLAAEGPLKVVAALGADGFWHSMARAKPHLLHERRLAEGAILNLVSQAKLDYIVGGDLSGHVLPLIKDAGIAGLALGFREAVSVAPVVL